MKQRRGQTAFPTIINSFFKSLYLITAQGYTKNIPLLSVTQLHKEPNLWLYETPQRT